MIRISYGRMFLGGAIVNVMFSILCFIIGLALALLTDDSEIIGTVLLYGVLNLTLGSIVCGVFCIIVLAIFGKKEENVVYVEKPQEKVIYVVKDGKEDRSEDYSRYMPRHK